MASAIYRAGDIEAIVEMYAEGAVVRCGCGGVKTITGNEALRAYRIDRLREYPAGTLDDLNPWHEGVIISYDPGAIQARVGSRVGLAGQGRPSRGRVVACHSLAKACRRTIRLQQSETANSSMLRRLPSLLHRQCGASA